MSVPLFDTATPLAPLHDELHAKLAEVLDAGRYILGPEVAAFERELADYLGAPQVVGVANGTDALVLALEAMGVPVLEDAAQAVGSRTADGRRAGALGAAGTFSFFPSKNLGAFGDGGAIA